MTQNHSELKQAAIVAAAQAAGAFDPDGTALFIPASEDMHPVDAVAALKLLKPYLFKPRSARDMTLEEYEVARQKIAGRRHHLMGRSGG